VDLRTLRLYPVSVFLGHGYWRVCDVRAGATALTREARARADSPVARTLPDHQSDLPACFLVFPLSGGASSQELSAAARADPSSNPMNQSTQSALITLITLA
jgi:hypothetical protein